MTFKEQYLNGLCGLEMLEACTKKWHAMKVDSISLRDYLGLTEQEYDAYLQTMKRRNDPQPHLRGAVCAGNIVPAFLCGVSVDLLNAATVQTEPHKDMGPICLFSQFDCHC